MILYVYICLFWKSCLPNLIGICWLGWNQQLTTLGVSAGEPRWQNIAWFWPCVPVGWLLFRLSSDNGRNLDLLYRWVLILDGKSQSNHYLRIFVEYVCFNHVLSKSRTKNIFYYFGRNIWFFKHILVGIGSFRAMQMVHSRHVVDDSHDLHRGTSINKSATMGKLPCFRTAQMVPIKLTATNVQSVLLLKFETPTLSNQTMTLGEPARYLLGCTHDKWYVSKALL